MFNGRIEYLLATTYTMLETKVPVLIGVMLVEAVTVTIVVSILVIITEILARRNHTYHHFGMEGREIMVVPQKMSIMLRRMFRIYVRLCWISSRTSNQRLMLY